MTRQSPNGNQSGGQDFNGWLSYYDIPEINQQTENLPIRRDMITLLTYVRDNKVVGTKSTGNMPLKAIRTVTALFVDPPQLDTTIGEQVYRLRTEMDVWPLYYLHILAEVGGLLNIAPGKRWKLTADGKRFLDKPTLIQVLYLFTVWWESVNWLVAYPMAGLGDELPQFFNVFTLGHIHETCRVEKSVSFEEFADGLIEKTGLVWTAQDSTFARMFLHSSIEQMVINILVTFGGAECEYREKDLGVGTTTELDTFKITPLGWALLEAITITI